jgi:hypothetical protein
MYSLEHSHIISLIDFVNLGDEFRVNSALGIEESDEHCLDFSRPLFEPFIPFKMLDFLTASPP